MTSTTPSSSPQLFHCPTCGASLPVPDDDPSVRCEYCGSNVLVPPEYRKQKGPDPRTGQAAVVIQLSGAAEAQTGEAYEAAQRSHRSIAAIIGGLVLFFLVIGIVVSVLAAAGAFTTAAVISQSISQQAATLPAVVTESALPQLITPSPIPDYSFVMQFGAKGGGPGQFDDARHLALDLNGNIYTAEYQDGRLQRFDADGKFQRLIQVEPDDSDLITISDMASDYQGRLLVARRGDILIYNAADGTLLQKIMRQFPETWYGAVAVDPANMIYALHIAAGELDLIKISPDGQVLWRKAQITEGLVKKSEVSRVSRLAVDGLGNIYLLDESQNQVYQFDSQGNFVDRFGSKGDGPGLLDSPADLTVDGQGRLYILDQDGIEVFDNTGRHIKLIPDDYQGHAFDIKLDLQGYVYLITNAPQVYKLSLDLGE